MRLSTQSVRPIIAAIAIAVGVGWLVSAPRAQSTGQSYTTLQPGYTQELYGVTGDFDPGNPLPILGGVAFAPDGDVWSSECVFLGTRLHRFDQHATYAANGTTLHPETIVDLTASAFGPAGGCGMVNHPNGFIYSNSSAGIWELNADTGLPTGAAIAHPTQTDAGGSVLLDFNGDSLRGGNGLGIAVDPQTHHLIYVGDDCHPTLSFDSMVCTYWDLDPVSRTVQVFARFDRAVSFVDGIYFDPSGDFVFGAYRESDSGTGEEHSLLVTHRPLALQPADALVDNTQIVRQVPMVSEPDGVAFHAASGGVVTLNESPDCTTVAGALVTPVSETLYDEFGDPYANVKSCPAGSTAIGGTMSAFDFHGDYASAPTHSLFASGGFRGDLLQVGADGCIYATQGALFEASQTIGTRYDDASEAPENSIVRICGGFTPPPGVTGSVEAQAFADQNGNNTFDAGEALSGVTVTLTTPTGEVLTGSTDATGTVTFDQLVQGTYTLSIEDVHSGDNAPVSTTATPTVTTGQTTPVAFEFAPLGTIGGLLFDDQNQNGVADAGEPGLPGVTVTLTGTESDGTPVDSQAITDASGTFTFTALGEGTYTVTVPPTVGDATTTTTTTTVTLTPGEGETANTGYTTTGAEIEDLSGVVYADLNRNSVRDAGEPGIGGVTVTLAGTSSATTTSAADGSYSFATLMAGDYAVSAPATAAGRALGTASPLNVSLPAGTSSPNHDFGYVSGSVSGTVFSDNNGNGVQDAGEPGTPGVTVTLSGPNGTTTTTTDATGNYTFPDLPAGDYTVTVPPIVGGEATTTPTTTVTVTPGQTVTGESFGYEGGSVSGTVFSDTSGNGTQDAGEPGTSGVVVTISGPGGTTTTTDANGAYTFPDLPAGTYTVSVPPTVGGEAAATSATTVTVAPRQTVTAEDFSYLSGGLSGFAYVDTNRNSTKDGGEAVLSGVLITVAGQGTATTAADGSYAFTNLDAGTYSVSAPATAAGKQRFTASPLSVPLAAGQTQPNVNFGYVPGSIAGFAYKDFNNNGVRNAGEPGIPGVGIILSGAASGAVSTGSTGEYLLSSLNSGTYAVSAPASAAGLTRSTPSPLTVTLAAGEARTNVNFGYRETTMPTCPYVIQSGPPTKVIFTIQDTGGGLASVQITQLTNFSVVLAPPSGSPITTVTTVNYNPPTTAPVTLTATRINGSQSASITFKAKDAFGNTLSCDPTVVTVGSIGRLPGGRQGLRKLLRENGTSELVVVENVPDTEHYITVQNNTPGLRQIGILVNERWFRVTNLTDGQTVQLDVASAMVPGNGNRIVIVGRGRPNGTALVTIADIYVP